MISVPYGKHALYYSNSKRSMPLENDLFFITLISCFLSSSSKDSEGYTQDFHAHFYYEFHYIYEGSCDFKMDDGSITTVNAGEFLLLPPKCRHQIVSESRPFGKLAFSFSISAKKNFYRTALDLCNDIKPRPVNTSIVCMATTIAENILKKQREYLNIIYFSQIALIIEIFRIIVGSNELSSYDTENIRIRNAVDFIHVNIAWLSSVNDVAKHLHISSKQLTRIFQQAMNTTPGAYIKEYKISCVCDLLSTTDLSIADIASYMNFPDPSALIKTFKRSKGITPLQYRKLHSDIN